MKAFLGSGYDHEWRIVEVFGPNFFLIGQISLAGPSIFVQHWEYVGFGLVMICPRKERFLVASGSASCKIMLCGDAIRVWDFVKFAVDIMGFAWDFCNMMYHQD